MEWARSLAATAWCAEKTASKTMDVELAEEFAKILVAQRIEHEKTQKV